MTNLQFYLDNFKREWQSGQDSLVYMECHAGQVWLSFHLHVDHPPHKQQEHWCQYGPSRLCRRARRAEARAAANAAIREHVAVAVNSAEKAVLTEADQQPSCTFICQLNKLVTGMFVLKMLQIHFVLIVILKQLQKLLDMLMIIPCSHRTSLS